MSAIQIYYKETDDWRELEIAARAALPPDERYKQTIIMTPISQKPKHKQDGTHMTNEQKQQVIDGLAVVVGVMVALNRDEIDVSILSGQEHEAMTDSMRNAFWQAVAATGTEPEQFKVMARSAVKCKLLEIDRGACACGGGAGFDFLTIPTDFSERARVFMQGKKGKGKRLPMPEVFTMPKPEPNQGRTMPMQQALFG